MMQQASQAMPLGKARKTSRRSGREVFVFDRWLLLAVVSLAGLGLVMVASASTSIAERQTGDAFYYLCWRWRLPPLRCRWRIGRKRVRD